MVWPTSTVNTVQTDKPTDSPSGARFYLNQLAGKINDLVLSEPRIAIFDEVYANLEMKSYTQDVWIGAGPTNAGAAITWNALDNVPVEATSIVVFVFVYGTWSANVFVRPYGFTSGKLDDQRLFDFSTKAASPMTLMSGHLFIPVASRRFEFNKMHAEMDATSSGFHLNLVGYAK